MMLDEVYFLSYEELKKYDDQRLVKAYDELFNELLNEYPYLKDIISRKYSICDNYQLVEQYQNRDISTYLFEGDKVLYYPVTKEVKARKEHICVFSGAIINRGSYYLKYKPFLYNVSKGFSVVGKDLALELNSGFIVPKTLEEFEEWCCKLDNAYELGLEDNYNMSVNMGGRMVLKRLRS